MNAISPTTFTGPCDLEDALAQQLARLIGACERHAIDFDLLIVHAKYLQNPEPDVEESG